MEGLASHRKWNEQQQTSLLPLVRKDNGETDSVPEERTACRRALDDSLTHTSTKRGQFLQRGCFVCTCARERSRSFLEIDKIDKDIERCRLKRLFREKEKGRVCERGGALRSLDAISD